MIRALIERLFPHRFGRRLAAIGAAILACLPVIGAFRAPDERAQGVTTPAVDPETSCGPVSLAVVGRWLGVDCEIVDLNRRCRVGDGGVCSLRDVWDAAESLGLAAQAVRLDPNRPFPDGLPMILHLHGDHFVPALPIDDVHLVLVDLPGSPVVRDRRRLAEEWDGTALLVAEAGPRLDRALAGIGLAREE